MFYRVRFGDAVLTDEESKAIQQTLDQLDSAISGFHGSTVSAQPLTR